jgi:hypothetical protein
MLVLTHKMRALHCCNLFKIQRVEALIKKYLKVPFVIRISPYLTPSLVEIKAAVTKTDKNGVLTITGYPTNSESNRQLIMSLLTP